MIISKKINLFLTAISIAFSTYSYSQSGNLDSTFGVNGIVTTDFGPKNDMVSAMTRQGDGKIILAGASNTGNGYREFALARYNQNGSLDNTFSSDGKLTAFFGTDDAGNAMALQTDGKIVLAGGIFNGTYADVAVVRFKTDGSIDSSFNKVGYVTTGIGNKTEYARSLAIQSDGKIITGGAYNDDKEFNFALVRYNSDGRIDSSFSNDGIVTINMGAGNDIIFSLVLQSDGKIIVTGPVGFGSGVADFVLLRFNPDGTLDNSFGSLGKVITSFNDGEDFPQSVRLQTDGKIIVVGYTTDTSGDQDIAIARYNKDGSLDMTFSSDGMVTTDISTIYDGASDVALQQDGKIVITGYTYNGSSSDVLLARYNTVGSLDNSFGKGGIQIYSFTDDHDVGVAVLIQPDSKILVGGYSTKFIDYYFTLSRYLSNADLGIINLSHFENEVFLYPNPINGSTNLKYTLLNEEIITIQLLDLQSRIIKTFIENEKQFAGKHKQIIDLPIDLASGNYLINISSANGQVSIKIIK